MVEEAERSLSLAGIAEKNYSIDKDKKRLESVKAGAIAAAVGTIAELPFALSQVSSIEQLLLPLGVAFASCALFGVTLRYAVRRDLDDSRLKSGAVTFLYLVISLNIMSKTFAFEMVKVKKTLIVIVRLCGNMSWNKPIVVLPLELFKL
ncbi:hypothetical protein AALP_AA7G072200 [Arabis alpina]|uniref:Uncharacterized protein n=1 Tax=Arabis alpina TaxID=50452 RepID=A0A087GGH2_ARAAL|nr:hypothetical protein AALP_AA7G072200 [Arabis alpina]